MNNRKMLLLLICIQKYNEKRVMRKVPKLYMEGCNFRGQVTFQLSLAAMQNKSRRY